MLKLLDTVIIVLITDYPFGKFWWFISFSYRIWGPLKARPGF